MITYENTERLAHIHAPAGTTADSWQAGEYRIVLGPKRSIPGRAGVNVQVTAAQLADGTIDDGSVVEAPKVYPDHPVDLTAAQARGLAALLLAAADEIDGLGGPMISRAD